jgi:3-dehydroquinate synthase class II
MRGGGAHEDKFIGHSEAENPEYVAIRPFLRDCVARHRK